MTQPAPNDTPASARSKQLLTVAETEQALGRSGVRTSEVESCEGPIDKTALLQMIHGPDCNIELLHVVGGMVWSDDPIQVAPCPTDMHDFTGLKYGGGIVTGYFGKFKRRAANGGKGKNRNYWVIRCLCGSYQLINHHTLKRPNTYRFFCVRCVQIRDIKRGFGTYRADWETRRIEADFKP